MRNTLPPSRIENILDQIAKKITTSESVQEQATRHELSNFIYHLIFRHSEHAPLNNEKFWSWIKNLDPSMGYAGEYRERLTVLISTNNSLRQAIQRLVLIEAIDEHHIRARAFHLSKCLPSLCPNTDDVAVLLKYLDPDDHSDQRWRDVMQLVQHDGHIGADTGELAKPFAKHDPELLVWIDS